MLRIVGHLCGDTIGYIGEDTALIAGLMRRGPVVYHSGVKVYHRRRAFPEAYLRQRWRYRVKTRLTGIHDNRIWAFLAAGTATIVIPALWPVYYLITLILGAKTTRLPITWWPFPPFAFAAHHLTYYFGILWGLARNAIRTR